MCFHLDQKLTQKVAQIILCNHATKQFLSCLIQNMFYKTLVAFDFDEKLARSVAQRTM